MRIIFSIIGVAATFFGLAFVIASETVMQEIAGLLATIVGMQSIAVAVLMEISNKLSNGGGK